MSNEAVVNVESQVVAEVTKIESSIVPLVGAEPAESEAQLIPAKIMEIVVWNQSPVNISVGAELLKDDQFHISIMQQSHLPKDLNPEMAPGLTHIKPNDGTIFKLGRNPNEPKIDERAGTDAGSAAASNGTVSPGNAEPSAIAAADVPNSIPAV